MSDTLYPPERLVGYWDGKGYTRCVPCADDPATHDTEIWSRNSAGYGLVCDFCSVPINTDPRSYESALLHHLDPDRPSAVRMTGRPFMTILAEALDLTGKED